MGGIGFEYWVVVVGVYWGLLDTGWFLVGGWWWLLDTGWFWF